MATATASASVGKSHEPASSALQHLSSFLPQNFDQAAAFSPANDLMVFDPQNRQTVGMGVTDFKECTFKYTRILHEHAYIACIAYINVRCMRYVLPALACSYT